MLDDHWTQVSQTLTEALELPPEERSAFLRRSIEDPELLADVQALLDAHESDAEWLERPLLGQLPVEEPLEGVTVGPYRVFEVVGEGGMGIVYRAERADGSFHRTVALKVVKPGMDTRAVLRRFEAERRILGRLEHPAIARLYDAGATELGRPWLAMEFVEGVPITEHAEGRDLSTEERLKLFRVVCDAVEHAHRNLTIHRDLKPSNILVRAEDGSVTLLDFGVAKLLEEDEAVLTRTGEKIMTRPYASPEQIRGEPATTATDVWALGVLLYELLTGRRPFVAEGALALERAILDDEPVLPRDVNGELGAVCRKALRKESGERYASAVELGADVQRWLMQLPVEARPPSAMYYARKFVTRHRTGVAVSLAAVTGLAAVGVTYTTQIASERNTARLEAEKARQVADFMGGLFRDADPAETGGTQVTAREVLDRAAARLESEVTARPEIRAQLFRSLGEVYTSLALFDRAESILARAEEIRRGALGDDHPDAADDLIARSSLALARGRHHVADSLATAALALRRSAFGDRDSRTAGAMLAAASTAHVRGDYETAERLQRDALAIVEAATGPEDPEVAHVKTALAQTLQAMDRWEDAERLFREALDARRALFGDRHPDVAASMAALGGLYSESAQFEDAEPLLREALDLERALYGENHPAVADAINRLATLRMLEGDYDRAEALFEQAVHLARTAFAGPNVRLAEHLHALASDYLYRDRWAEARPILDEALAIADAAVGEAHPVTAQLLADRALAVGYLGDQEASEADYRRALAIERELYGENHSAYVTTLASLGTLLAESGRMDEGIALTREALELRRGLLPEGHPALANSLYSLGTQYLYSDSVVAARPYIAESAQIRRAVYGRLDWRTIQADGRLAHIRSLLDDEGAEEALLDAFERSRTELSADFSWVRDQIVGYLAAHYDRAGEPRRSDVFRAMLPADS